MGQVEMNETENGNGKLKRKAETERLKFGNGRIIILTSQLQSQYTYRDIIVASVSVEMMELYKSEPYQL